MSLVTTVVVFGSGIPAETGKRLMSGEFTYGDRSAVFGDLCEDIDRAGIWGGQKFPEADVYGGAFNHLHQAEFFDWLRSLDWGHGGAVAVWECNGETQGVERLGVERLGDYQEVL